MKHPSGADWCVLTMRNGWHTFVCKRCGAAESPVNLGIQALAQHGLVFATAHRSCSEATQGPAMTDCPLCGYRTRLNNSCVNIDCRTYDPPEGTA